MFNLRKFAGAACLALGLATPGFASTLSTGFAGTNGASGNMFDIQIGAQDILLTDLQVHIDRVVTTTVSFWFRVGTHVGNETSSAGWTLLDSSALNGQGEGNPTDWNIANQAFTANTLFGLFIHDNTSDIGYADSLLSPTEVLAQNSDLTIFAGNGRLLASDPFSGGVIPGRAWNGTFIYDIAASPVPLPGSLPLLLAGMAGLAGLRYRKKRAAQA